MQRKGTIEVIPGNVYIDISLVISPSRDGCPATAELDVEGRRTTFDRVSEIRITINLFILNHFIGSSSISIAMPQGVQRTSQKAFIMIPCEVVDNIESLRQEKGVEDLQATVRISGSYLSGGTPYGQFILDYKPIDNTLELSISISEWKKVLGLAEHRILLLSPETVKTLNDLRKSWGLWRVEDVIEKFIEIYSGREPEVPVQFLVTIVESKTIRDKIQELVSKHLWREVRVISLYLDHAGVEYLLKLINNGTKVKLITRKPDRKEHVDAVKALKQSGVSIKINNMAHARMIIFDDLAAIISSADLDSEGLINQRQAGIYIADRIIVRECITFFEMLWSESIEQG